jgi:ABC-type multidrug transport system fused ATPase/permease subunit
MMMMMMMNWVCVGAQGDGQSRSGNVADNPDLDRHVLVLSMSVVALILLQAVRGYLFTRQTLVASSTMHGQLFERILKAPMGFFDTTPTGRVLSYFSKDIDEIDAVRGGARGGVGRKMC